MRSPAVVHFWESTRGGCEEYRRVSTGAVGLLLLNGCSNGADSLKHISWFHIHKCETKPPVGIFMNSFKTQALLEADTPGLGWCDEAEVSYEENLRLIHRLV